MRRGDGVAFVPEARQTVRLHLVRAAANSSQEGRALRMCINIEYIAPILRGAINLQYIVNT